MHCTAVRVGEFPQSLAAAETLPWSVQREMYHVCTCVLSYRSRCLRNGKDVCISMTLMLSLRKKPASCFCSSPSKTNRSQLSGPHTATTRQTHPSCFRERALEVSKASTNAYCRTEPLICLTGMTFIKYGGHLLCGSIHLPQNATMSKTGRRYNTMRH
jgi:hypothetical protein